jgi:hypothetical protein
MIHSEVIEFVCNNYQIKRKWLLSAKRDRKFAFPRQVCMYLLRRKGLTLMDIGKIFGRDHSTVMHALAQDDVKNEAENLIAELPFDSGKVFPDHEPETQSDPELLYPSITKFPSRYTWLFKKIEPKCQICGFDDVIEVHHLISPKKGGKDVLSNLLILCPNHHSLMHAGLLKFKEVSPKLSTDLSTVSKDSK